MKFPSLTLALLFVFFCLSALSLSTDEKNVKKEQITTNLKAAKLSTTAHAATTAAIGKKTVANVQTAIKKTTVSVAAAKGKVKKGRTHADPSYVSALIDPTWKYQGPEAKKDYSQLEKVQSNRRYEKAKSMDQVIFNTGHSASASKLFNSFLGDAFKSEAKAAFSSFQKGSGLTATDISQGFADNNWKIFGSLEDLGNFYYGIYHSSNKKGGMTEAEFVYMMIDVTFPYNTNYDCKNCFQNSRKEIKKLFSFLDCDTKGFVHAINLYDVLKQMKGSENLKTTDVNEWLLKEDYRGIGRLDSKQFAEGILKTLYEVTYLE